MTGISDPPECTLTGQTGRQEPRERERETADSWLAKQTDRQQTSPHLHIFPNLTSYKYSHPDIFSSSHPHIFTYTFTSSHLHTSHLHIFSSSHLLRYLLIFTSSHPHILTSSHLHPSHLHTLSYSHLLIFTSSHPHPLFFTSAHLHIFPFSHLLIFTPSHRDIFTSSHPQISNLHIFTSSHPLIFTSAILHIFSSSPSFLHIFSSSPSFLHISKKLKKRTPATKPRRRSAKTFSGTKVNPWNHPQILRPAGVRNLDLSAPKSSKSGPPQQSLADVLRNLLRNQSEPLESSADTTTRGGPEFGPFSPEKLKKRTPASRQTTSPQNTNISQRLDRSWMSVCCAECFSLSATAARLAAESPRPRTHQWPRETMACAASPADPLEQPSARRLHLRKSHLPEE